MTPATAHTPTPEFNAQKSGKISVATSESIEVMVREELAGDYRVLEVLGWGRWGLRFRVEDIRRAGTGILTALPAIDPGDATKGDLYLEALMGASRLDHPHLVPITGYGVSGPLRWFVIPVTEEKTLAARIEGAGALSLNEVRRIGLQLASALDQAHRHGISHGALSTNDVLVDGEGWVRLLEVGIAAGVEPSSRSASRVPPTGQGTDQVAFAGILRAALTGGSPSAPLPAGIPTGIEGVLRRATDPRPMARFRDLRDLANALDTDSGSQPRLEMPMPETKGSKAPGWEAFLDTEELESPPPPVAPGRKTKLGTLVALGFVSLFAAGWSLFRTDEPPVLSAITQEATPTPPPAPPIASAPPPVVSAAPPVVRTPTSGPLARTPRPTLPARRAAPSRVVPATAPAPAVPGFLSVSSFPWGELMVDGRRIGNTPRAGIILEPGRHTLRISRDGYQSFETTFDLVAGTTLRLAEVTLTELAPR